MRHSSDRDRHAGEPVCRRCGTCCVAPDIAALGKPLGQRCPHLLPSGLCSIYDNRPPVCSGYRPDDLCDAIDAPTLEERVSCYLELFGLGVEDTGIKKRTSG